jgi:hypothetical protein
MPERKACSVLSSSDRRREHRESAAVVARRCAIP